MITVTLNEMEPGSCGTHLDEVLERLKRMATISERPAAVNFNGEIFICSDGEQIVIGGKNDKRQTK